MGITLPFRAAASALLARYQWARQAGMSFGGARDLYEVLGYARELTTRDYRDRYYRGGIAKRIVDVYPNATWRGQMELIEDENPEVSTAFEQAWEEIDTKHQLQAKLQRTDKLSALSTYAVLLIGAPGEMDTELPRGKPKDLLYFRPAIGGGGTTIHARGSTITTDSTVSIATYETDPRNPRFGLPLSYNLRAADGLPYLADMRPIHWTRVHHIAEGCLEDDIFGVPALESVWNLLDDLDKVTGGGAEAFWLRANQGVHLDIDKDMAIEDAKASAELLKEQADLYKHQLTRWLRTRGVSAEVLGSDVANFAPSADAIITQIAGAKGIPKRILTGSEMGELASSQDRENWRDQVVGRQKGFAGPYMVRPLVARLMAYGYLPEPKEGPEGYEVKWPNQSIMTEEERQQGAAAWAATTTVEGQVFSNAEIRDKWYELEPLTPKEQEALKPAPKEIMIDKDGKPLELVPKKKKDEDDEEELEDRAAQELIRVLETAVTEHNTEVIDRILGLERPAETRALESEDELVRVLADAIETSKVDVVDEILGTRFAGGAGSGNFGHAGRPGEIGGSGPGGARERLPRLRERNQDIRHREVAPIDAELRLFHSSSQESIPSFDAFFGGDEFVKSFSPVEFGEHRSEAILPKGTRILDLNRDSPLAHEFKAEIAKIAWPDDPAFHEALAKGDMSAEEDFYEAWTDKDNIVAALKNRYGTQPNVVAKYQDEYLIPKNILMRIPVQRIK